MTLAHTCRNTLEEWSQQRKLLKFIKFTQWQHIWIKIRPVDLVEVVPTVAPVDWQCWYLSADQQLLIYFIVLKETTALLGWWCQGQD